MKCYNKAVKKTILVLLLILLAQSAQAAITDEKVQLLDQEFRKIVSPVADKVGIYFIDLESGRELSINGERKSPGASIVKVPIMAAAFHLAESGSLEMSKIIKLRKEDKLGGSGVLQWMKPGKEYTIRNLIRMMIVLSDNTATRLIVRQMSLAAINDYMLSLGLIGTRIVDATMLNEPPKEALNLTTAADMAHLIALIKRPGTFTAEAREEMLSHMQNQRYRWGIWRGVPKGILVADKTGNVQGVLNDAGIVYSPAGNYIISILTSGFMYKKDARRIINKISDATYQIYVTGKYLPNPELEAKKTTAKKKVKVKRYRKVRRKR